MSALEFAAFLPHGAWLDLRGEETASGPSEPRPSRLVLGSGWSVAESEGLWSDALSATLYAVFDHDPGPLELYFECQPIGGPSSSRRQTVDVSIDGVSLGSVELDWTWNDYRLEVPRGTLGRGVHRLELAFAYLASPSELGQSDDPRKLSVRFAKIGLLRKGGSWEKLAASEPTLDDGRFLTRAAGRLLIPVRHGPAPAEFSLAASSSGRSAASLRLLHAALPEGETEVLAEAGTSDGRPGRLLDDSFPVRGEPGAGSCLILDLEPGARSQISIATAELTSEPAPAPGAAASFAEPPATLPDIVVILLDAARPDHFGCYGYGRNTTPRIDALAEQSLVFRNAFAESSYTRASIATMLTGLGFLDHRMVTHPDRLDLGATTLAESLAAIGYRTLCYSANPNNSVDSGLAQGCETFVDLWRGDRDLLEKVDPFRLSARAIRDLDGGGDERPLFLMLHYVPPHEPYHPTPEYDVFGAGSGADVDGTVETVRALDSGELELTAERRERLIALYDGNLLKGDAAVGQLLDALEARDRWQHTVVLVTSDHGEAFGEHGRMSHGTTVYDEMLRVPFILRLPPGLVPAAVDTEALVSLADVVPTVLGLVGLRPEADLSGFDLLGDAGRRGRSLLANSAVPEYAYRTLEWKAILNDSPGRSELYHVASDPAESENLVLLHLDRFYCIRGLVQQAIAGGAPPRQPESRPDEVDSESLEALRDLGYLD